MDTIQIHADFTKSIIQNKVLRILGRHLLKQGDEKSKGKPNLKFGSNTKRLSIYQKYSQNHSERFNEMFKIDFLTEIYNL